MLLLILFSVSALNAASAEFPSYAYAIEDPIPREVQLEIISLLSSQNGLAGTSAKKSSLTAALNTYLNCFGIYPPVDRDSEIVPWLQETLSRLGRVTEIPQRYATGPDIRDWLTHFAEPGDLLLYRANGQPDRCLLYAGDGKYIGKRQEKYALLDVPASFAASNWRRTSNSGIYGIGRIWSSPEDDPPVLEFAMDDEPSAFTGMRFTLLAYDPVTGFTSGSADYVLFEYAPGVFRLWNGSISGVFPENFSGKRIRLFLSGQTSDQLPWCFSFFPEDYADDNGTVRIPVRLSPVYNLHRWYGRDLLLSLAPDTR